jgi:hypothetical protein
MEQTNFKSDYSWVIRVLESSESYDQIKTSEKLFEVLLKKYQDHITVCGSDCLYESLLREEFQYFLDIKLNFLQLETL